MNYAPSPLQVAIHLIRPYVTRGDSYEEIRGYMGAYTDEYGVILKGEKIFVERIGDQDLNPVVVIPLQKVYEIVHEGLFQPSLFPDQTHVTSR